MRASKVLLVGIVLGCGRADPAPSPPPLPAQMASNGATAAAGASPPAAAPAEPEVAAPAEIAPADALRIDAAAQGAIDRNEIPGAVVVVVAGDRVVYQRAYGLRAKEPAAVKMTLDTLFDLASLTKPLATATSIALLGERGLHVSDPVARHLPTFAAHGKASVTIEQLLLHTSGLPAANPLSAYASGRAEALSQICATAAKTPPGEAFLYSDLGYIVLGELAARAAGTGLETFVHERLAGPLAMRDTTFKPSPRLAARAAPSEKVGDQFLLGHVHDPRARALGGVAGHAGLFSTAFDLSTFARMLLGRGSLGGSRVLAESTVATLLLPREIPGGRRAYFGSASGDAVSHTGFTGTSFWIDPRRKIAVIVLSNRVHPDGKGSADRLRREVIEASVVAATNTRTRTMAVVKTGIDALAESGFELLRGRKIALLTHAAGRARDGRSTIDVLHRAPGVTLVALLSPEHGLRSTEDGAVADAGDPRTGLAVHSLYGDEKRPTRAMLAGADTIVVDLQDAGARFYTYETTVGYTLEAAAKLGVRVLLLDRPNPIGGTRIAGPVLDAGRESFVGYHRVPIAHGMTLGELARLYDGERKLAADLVVVPMKGWKRSASFADTGLAWTPPSPNLTSPTAALLYPGVGLVELTNVSVGRGTGKPFEQLGAPWIDGAALAEALRAASLPGLTFTKTTFTPAASTFAGRACSGVAIAVTEPREVDAVRLGLTLAVTLRKLFPDGWAPNGLATLLGHARAFAAITAGEPLERVLATFTDETAGFAERRRPYLLH